MADLILQKIAGVSTEAEHHRIAKIIKLASTEAEVSRLEKDSLEDELAEAKAEVTQLTNELTSEGITARITMSEYPHSVGLIMGKELWISAPSSNLNILKQKVTSIRVK